MRLAEMLAWTTLTAGVALAQAGCTVVNAYEDPVLVGEWELDINPDSRMEIDLDGEGESNIETNLGTNLYDLDWTQEGEDEFEIEFKCEQHPSGCTNQDFIMTCEASSSGNNLDCQAPPELWQTPDFEWRRD